MQQSLLFFLCFLGEGVLGLIFGEALDVGGGLVELAGFQGAQVLMSLQLALTDLEHLHGAFAVPEAADMAGLDLPNQQVDDLLLGLHIGAVVCKYDFRLSALVSKVQDMGIRPK